ncbi:MAG TPA: ribosome maturation factor RimP [Myxococcota bacterium]|jgi:ribosome maturation factor RimP|nr:ribosome maturation factor RimP [Myxococcota bacterium]
MNEEVQAIRQVADGAAAVHGCEVWDVQYARGGKGAWVLRVFIDRPGGVTLDHCEAVSKDLSARLDVDDLIPHRYVLEVSSPGLTRALTEEAHWRKSVGALCRAVTADGAAHEGRIVALEGGAVRLAPRGGGPETTFPLAEVKRANLMFDEERNLTETRTRQ